MFERRHKMTKDLKHYLYVVFSKLSFDEGRGIIAYLKDMNLNSDTGFKDIIDEIRKKRYKSGFFCPHCESKKSGKIWLLSQPFKNLDE